MITIEQIHFRYGRKKPLLFEDLTLQVQAGNICGLLGRNGAGKTTLLKLMSGLLFPKSGNCQVLGHKPGTRKPEFLQEVFFLPEEFYAPKMSPNQYAQRYAPYYPNFNREQYGTLLSEFGLNPTTELTSMSYGQKKKALLSFGLASNCRLLLLDEPTNGLDIPSKSQFRKLLAGSLSDEQSCIISTHQVRDLGNLIDPIIILDQGKIIFHQEVAQIHQKLSFDLLGQKPESSIHYERVPGGYMVLSENQNGHESEVDIEVLFNAVIQQTEQIQSHF